MHRRVFLGTTAALPLMVAMPEGPVQAGGWGPGSPGLIVRQTKPENFESPFPALGGFLTPNNLFFVRSHFGVFAGPGAATWRLKVEGAVEHPLELTFEELLRMPSRTLPATLECAGNGRVFLVPRAQGVPWELGAVSTAEWTGVPLAAVLDRAGVRSNAVEVVLEGADVGEVQEEPKSPGRIHYARSLPLAKARRPEVLLAYRMNGAELPVAHGYPLRAVVPGWYGMASVKWLRRIVVTDRPFTGFFQTLDYAYFVRRDGLPVLVPAGEMEVKSQIARPARGEVVSANAVYRTLGAAWTGESEVERVEVSADGGRTWAAAALLGRPVPYAWRLWEYGWRTPAQPGVHILMARAADRRGRVQPLGHDPDRRNILINYSVPLEVEVR
jgi:DMSO/TMAO reductase YedYZ molybdopterin-dependent catalytic subunit